MLVDPDNTLYFQSSSNKCRVISHYQYVAWPDHGVPNDPAPCIQGLKDINRELDIYQSAHKIRPPVVVHCSAG